MKKTLFVCALSVAFLLSSTPALAAYSWIKATSAGIGNWGPNAITISADGSRMAAVGENNPVGRLVTSTDSGVTWAPKLKTANWSSLAGSADGTRLVAGHKGGNVYTSTDGGTTWTTRTILGKGDWFAAASDASGMRLAVGSYGGYIYTSIDGGVTWTSNGGSSGKRDWRGLSSDTSGTNLVAIASGDYIYTSKNGGVSWTASTGPGKNFWGGVASDATGMILEAVYQLGPIYRSTNGGASWVTLPGAGTRRWSGVASDGSGNILIASDNGEYPYTSNDGGATWTKETAVGKDLWWGVAVSLDGWSLAAGNDTGYIWTTKPDNGPNRQKLVVTTTYADSITKTTATLNGFLAATGGAPTTAVGFSYGLTTTYTAAATAPAMLATGSFKSPITGLTCGTLYHYQANANNIFGGAFGYDATFTTLPCTSTGTGTTFVFTTPFGLASTGAKVTALQQILRAQGYFTGAVNGIYGVQTMKAVMAYQKAYGITPANGSVGAKTITVLNGGKGEGASASLGAVSTLEASSVTKNSAILRGSMTANAQGVTPVFLYGTTLQYGSVAKSTSSSSGATAVVTGLACATTYHYKISVQSSSGTSNGGDMKFTTLPCSPR
jgi:hypothetical protein